MEFWKAGARRKIMGWQNLTEALLFIDSGWWGFAGKIPGSSADFRHGRTPVPWNNSDWGDRAVIGKRRAKKGGSISAPKVFVMGCGLLFAVDGSFQIGARGKFGNFLGGDFDGFACLGIPASPGFAGADGESAEAYECHAATLLQLRRDSTQNGIDSGVSLGLVHTCLLRNLLDQISFVHVYPLLFIEKICLPATQAL
jgi:hypothetical protein